MNSTQSPQLENSSKKNSNETNQDKKSKVTPEKINKTKSIKNESIDNHLNLLSEQLKEYAETIRLIKEKRSQEEKQ